MTRLAVNDIQLNVEVQGEGPALLLLHGFTGSVETWAPFLDAWSGYRTVRVDIIGHGGSDSPARSARYGMNNAVADLLAVLDQLGIEETALLGYSMGGRLALHLALAAPERIAALVLESASPGIADEAERAERRRADFALADSIESDGPEGFIDRWQAQPLFASQANLPAAVFLRQRLQRLRGSPLGYANSLRGMGAGSQEYLLPRLGELSMPVLLLAGALDERYAAPAGELGSVIPGSEVTIIESAGHAAHLERPDAFAALVSDFLARHVDRLNERGAGAQRTGGGVEVSPTPLLSHESGAGAS